MSIANSTLHFHFPLVTGTDRPLFEDYNQTMETLDEKLYESISTLETIPQEITDLQAAVNGIAEQVTALETFETEQTGTNQLVNNAILALQQAVAVIPTKFDSAGIADPYDAEHGTYVIGNVVTYNGQRYVCTQAVTAAEPFDADKWNAVDVQTEISAINSVIDGECLKDLYSVDQIGLTDTSSLGQIVYAIAQRPRTRIHLFVNNSTTWGQTIQNEINTQTGAGVLEGFVTIERLSSNFVTFTFTTRAESGYRPQKLCKTWWKNGTVENWSTWGWISYTT